MNQISVLELVERPAGATDILGSIREFRDFGRQTELYNIGGLPYVINEFWTAGSGRPRRSGTWQG